MLIEYLNLVDSKTERLTSVKPENLGIKPGFEMVIVIGKGLPERKAIFACSGFICVVEIQPIFSIVMLQNLLTMASKTPILEERG